MLAILPVRAVNFSRFSRGPTSLVSHGRSPACVRDVILPGEMKGLMNMGTEAKKAAEANLIARREETAATRSQANAAKLLQDNPTLMRLRELEVLEKVAVPGL